MQETTSPAYPLETKVVLIERGGNLPPKIELGNTGFKLMQRDDHYEHHYEPNSMIMGDGKTDQIKNTLIYADALWTFFEWWDNLPDPKVSLVKGKTNELLHKTRQKMLGNGIYICEEQSVDPDSDSYDFRFWYEIDLNKLKSDEDAKAKLRRLAERCRQRNYSMISAPPNSEAKVRRFGET